MNKNDSKRTNKSTKTKENLRDSMLGKKIVKGLNNSFFEKVLELEIKLKQGFNMETLQELIQSYTTAIEYFESVNDPRYVHYTQSLNILLSQPEILKQMNLRTKEGKKRFKREQFTQDIKTKSDKVDANQVNSQVVKTLLNHANNNDNAIKSTVETMINKDMEGQMSTFQQRREAKKKRIELSTSDITDAVETMKNKRGIGKKNHNKSFDIGDEQDDDMVFNKNNKALKEKENNDTQGNDVIMMSPIIKPKQAIINIEDDISMLSALSTNQLDMIDADFEKEMKPTTPNWSFNIRKKPPLKEILNSDLDGFVKEINKYLSEKIIQRHLKEIEEIYDKKIKEKQAIIRESTSEIKEKEYLYDNADKGDVQYKEQLQILIKRLNNKEKEDLSKIDEKYTKIITDMKTKFSKSLVDNCGIKLIKEKHLLDISKSLLYLFNK